MIGRYPDYDVLDAQENWDEATTGAWSARLHLRPAAVLHPRGEPTLRAFCDVTVAQDAEPRVPVAEMVDEKLASGRLDGYRYADMPDDRDTWRLVLRGLDETAERRYGRPTFAACDPEGQEAIVVTSPKGRWAAGRGISSTLRGRGRCACARSWPPSTPTRGRGTRSASAGRPTRGDTCAWARSAPSSPTRTGGHREDPVRTAPELGGDPRPAQRGDRTQGQ